MVLRLILLAAAATALLHPEAATAARLVAVTAPPAEHRADPRLKTYVLRFGPHLIGPYQTAKGTDTVKPPPVDGAVVGMDTRLVTAAGRVIPQHAVMLHHIVYTDSGPNFGRRDLACPQRPVAQRFYGTSEELRALTLPRGYGYPVTRRDRWRASWMVMNHQARERLAYVEYRVTIDTNPSLTPVAPLWLSVRPCRESPDPQYTVPGGGAPGSVDVRSRDWVMPFAGRVVAIGGHLHGGARGLTVAQPECRRALFTARPTYAAPDDPLYAVTPLLHEPDPKHISWGQSAAGWPVAAGSRLRVTATYDAERPHMRVMGIAHVYVARDAPAAGPCDAPADAEELTAPFPGRPDPPPVDLTLAAVGRDGIARPIARPPGRVRRLPGDAVVRVSDFAFRRPSISIARGSRVTWRFTGATRHDATLAAGPVGFASPTASGGARWSRRFHVPGEYRLLCSLHPVTMSQYVKVR